MDKIYIFCLKLQKSNFSWKSNWFLFKVRAHWIVSTKFCRLFLMEKLWNFIMSWRAAFGLLESINIQFLSLIVINTITAHQSSYCSHCILLSERRSAFGALSEHFEASRHFHQQHLLLITSLIFCSLLRLRFLSSASSNLFDPDIRISWNAAALMITSIIFYEEVSASSHCVCFRSVLRSLLSSAF